MNTKLTLTLDQSVIERAKIYAGKKGSSLSGLISNYLKVITTTDEVANVLMEPITKSLKGSFKATDDFDYKKELSKGLSNKYLKNG